MFFFPDQRWSGPLRSMVSQSCSTTSSLTLETLDPSGMSGFSSSTTSTLTVLMMPFGQASESNELRPLCKLRRSISYSSSDHSRLPPGVSKLTFLRGVSAANGPPRPGSRSRERLLNTLDIRDWMDDALEWLEEFLEWLKLPLESAREVLPMLGRGAAMLSGGALDLAPMLAARRARWEKRGPMGKMLAATMPTFCSILVVEENHAWLADGQPGD